MPSRSYILKGFLVGFVARIAVPVSAIFLLQMDDFCRTQPLAGIVPLFVPHFLQG